MTGLAGVVVAMRIPISAPMPVYLADARVWAATGRIGDTFTPLAYPLFIGPALRLYGLRGVLLLQILLQAGVAAIAYAVLRRLGLHARGAALGAALVALHPDLLASVSKVWDVTLSTALFLLLVLTALAVLQAGERKLLTVSLLTGIAFGLGLSCRPNYLLLAPAIALAFALRKRRLSPGGFLIRGLALIAAAAGAFSLASFASHGSIFSPHNGPYNLFAGHNQHTVRSLLRYENAEPALAQMLEETRHPDPDPDAEANSGWYTQQSIAFARAHPGTEFALVALKFLTLFRPDTKVHPLPSKTGMVRAVLASPVILLAVALLWPPRLQLNRADAVLLALEVCYVIPFLLTNSDPRFRTPLDMLLLLHMVSAVARRAGRQESMPDSSRTMVAQTD